MSEDNDPSVYTVLVGNLLHIMGINVNQTVDDLNNILNNEKSVEQLKQNISKFVNIADPLVDETINKIIQKWNDSIKKMGQNLSMSIIQIIPILGQVIGEINSIQLIFSNILDMFKSTGDILKNTLNSASNEFAKTLPQNPIKLPENPIKLPQNQEGGAKILSRIRRSVKQFMGKKNEFTNKEFINKKIVDKKITKKTKNINMKGGYNKNKNNIISQKGGQILSRIHKSLETFNNVRH